MAVLYYNYYFMYPVHPSILLYYINQGITRIFSLPEGYVIVKGALKQKSLRSSKTLEGRVRARALTRCV